VGATWGRLTWFGGRKREGKAKGQWVTIREGENGE